MAVFFAEQVDFILFFYGLAFILLGFTGFAIARQPSQWLSWSWLGLFALVHGVSEWLDLGALVLGDTPQFAALRTTALTVSYFLLTEFARRELKRQGYWVPGWWIYVPLTLLVALGGAAGGLNAANALARYAIGFVGASAASFVFVLLAKGFSGAAQRFASVAAAGLALYGIAAGLIVPPAGFWPADTLNQQWFLTTTGVPIQLIRGVLACCIAVSIWGIWGQNLILDVSSARYTRFLRKQFVATLGVMTAILLLGWVLTDYFGLVHKQRLEKETRGDLELLAMSLSSETAPIDAVVRSLAGSRTVRSSLSGEGQPKNDGGPVKSVLTLDVEASGARRGFVLDAVGALIAASGDDREGTSYATDPYFQRSMFGMAGRHFAFDPSTKVTEYYASYPVLGPAGKVVGVAVLTRSLEGFETRLRAFDRPLFLIDPQGVIALANRPAIPFQSALPPRINAEGGAWTTVEGESMYVRWREVAHSDWSLAIFVPVEGIFASRVLGIAITLLTTIMVLIYIIARGRAVHDHVQMDRRLELEELARILDHKATTDPLTGLSNRRRFNEVLSYEIARSRRFDTPLSLILYDIDHFKRINDSYGHQVGDTVLIKLSRFMRERMRATDLLARWGGEEFVILAPQSDGQMAAQFAEILKASVESTSFDDVGTVTCSFGVAELAAGETAEGFIARADGALYRAKLEGRNRVKLATEPGSEQTAIGSAA